jgi:8-oxo-dGTP pyrophosphatase MutT (NUDIX family)
MPAPTLIDRGFQLAYKVAHRMLRAYWCVRSPRTRGVLVAVWHDGEILIVKNSYRDHYTLPGGYQHSGESVEQTGARELGEECGIRVAVEALRASYHGVHRFEFRNDDVTLLEVELPTRPDVAIDNREVVWAGFKAPSDVLALPVVPHLIEYLEARGTPKTPA